MLVNRDPNLWRTGVRKGSSIVPLNRAMVSFFRLSTVTMPLNEAGWLQFAMQVFGSSHYPVRGNGGRRESQLVPQGSCRATLFDFLDNFLGETYCLPTIHTTDDRQTTDRRTQHRAINANVSTVG